MQGRARCAAFCILGGLLAIAAGARGPIATAQVLIPSAVPTGVARQVPSTIHFTTLPGYYSGNYRGALAMFVNESQNGLRNAASQWIDVIPAYTMAGECYYQLGQPQKALEQYDAALKLYVAYSDWMMRVQFQNPAPMLNPVRATPWGQSKRRATPGAFPREYTMGQGQIDQSRVVQQGGVVQAAIAFPVNVVEVVRCTSLAIRRRREIMGPVCNHDPLTQSVVDVLARKPGPPNHWSEAWINLQLGCAYAAAGNIPQAKTALEQSLLVGGQFDHPLAATALVELARLALESGDFPAAINYAEEATYSAANYLDVQAGGNWANLDEAFRIGMQAHLLLNQKGPFAPVAHALPWARSNNAPRQLQATLLLLAAENMITASDPDEATSLLNNARVTMARTDLAAGRAGAELNYLSAVVAYQTGNVSGGDQTLDAAMRFYRVASLWNFQIALADTFYTRGGATDRVALELYELLLRDPTSSDWSAQPHECLAMLSSDLEQPLEHWFELLLKSEKDRERAIEVADRARRHRFYSTLPLGGRLLALRWLLEGPAEMLNDEANLQRQNLLARYPQYAKLAEQVTAVRTRLAGKPAVADAPAARLEQGQALAELERLSQAQERILREMAVRREPAEMLFPPTRTLEEIKASLGDSEVLWAFFETRRNLHAFLMSNDRFAVWQVRSPATVKKQIGTLLRDMGNFDSNQQLSAGDLENAKLMSALLERSNVDLTGNFAEIVIVPDGPLWYLPFETLPIGAPDKQKLLVSQARVRYAPTVGLAVPYLGAKKPRPSVGVALGKLFPQDDEEITREAFERLAPAIAGAAALPRDLAAPAHMYRVLLDGLIVLDDVPAAASPYGWHPLAGKGAAPLGTWLSLPFGAPDQIVLPGFHTSAETGLKRGASGGDEIFLSLCGLLGSGARTVLISRWRTGGQTSLDLVREYSQELPHTLPAEAWQRGVQVVRDSPLDPDREPRLKDVSRMHATTANHPFFWAGYMLVDSGRPADVAAAVDPAHPAAPAGRPAGPVPAGPRPANFVPAAGPAPAGRPMGLAPPAMPGPDVGAADAAADDNAAANGANAKGKTPRNKPSRKIKSRDSKAAKATDA
jgi:tetratricopeptide (TPR) repeat protein/CHAT domain-containing protein